MEKIDELETSKFEDCTKEPISFDQDSVETDDCYFSVPQKQPFGSVSLSGSVIVEVSEVFDFP